jgi:hypothetical protein
LESPRRCRASDVRVVEKDEGEGVKEADAEKSSFWEWETSEPRNVSSKVKRVST